MKHLLGETDATEQQMVLAWVASSPEHLAYYEGLRKVWENSKELAATSTVNEQEAWVRFQQRLKPETSRGPLRSPVFGWQRIAAVLLPLLLIAGLGYLIFFQQNPPKQMLVSSGEVVKKDTLPDGSIVTLNKRSTLSYGKELRGRTRAVTLHGEAFFQVKPDKARPFTIQVGEVEVRVLGTSFNIRSDSGRTEVVVETGIVKVSSQGKTVELRANERIVVGNGSSAGVKEPVSDHLYDYYRSREFVCDDTPLWKLVAVLNEAYDAHIVFGREELRDLRMNTTFSNESLEQVLKVISLTFNLKIVKTNNEIVLE